MQRQWGEKCQYLLSNRNTANGHANENENKNNCFFAFSELPGSGHPAPKTKNCLQLVSGTLNVVIGSRRTDWPIARNLPVCHQLPAILFHYRRWVNGFCDTIMVLGIAKPPFCVRQMEFFPRMRSLFSLFPSSFVPNLFWFYAISLASAEDKSKKKPKTHLILFIRFYKTRIIENIRFDILSPNICAHLVAASLPIHMNIVH